MSDLFLRCKGFILVHLNLASGDATEEKDIPKLNNSLEVLHFLRAKRSVILLGSRKFKVFPVPLTFYKNRIKNFEMLSSLSLFVCSDKTLHPVNGCTILWAPRELSITSKCSFSIDMKNANS
ncbi:hypothetical protein NPIL_589271 [Nephila pilipes]|uniref:Uncharacterized protein n=1 Tax=Nephila pilipes TaxID=299642 RepID=A0A8X6PEI2_NEPPI|nr:hypothetical protein NPIL_589271 [Nephila pilipes]